MVKKFLKIPYLICFVSYDVLMVQPFRKCKDTKNNKIMEYKYEGYGRTQRKWSHAYSIQYSND